MSAAANRSAIARQKLARQRMRAARGLSLAETVTTKPSHQDDEMHLMPRIAEYRSKGWINEQEESDYQQLLSSNEKEVALQVKKSLDLAKSQHEEKPMTVSSAPTTNSRSLFRKQPSSTGNGELTLQKKLCHRRISRMAGHATPPPKKSSSAAAATTMEPKELSIVEAMFGKEEEQDAPRTPTVDKQKELLARARQRRRSSFSPDAAKPKVTDAQQGEQQPVEKPKVSTAVAATRLYKVGASASQRSIYNRKKQSNPVEKQSNPIEKQESLGEAPKARLSQSGSAEKQASESTEQQQEEQIEVSRPPVVQKEVSLGTVSTEQQQEQVEVSRPSDVQKQVSLGTVPTISLSRTESTDKQEIIDKGSTQETDDQTEIHRQEPNNKEPLQQVPPGETQAFSLFESKDQEENGDMGKEKVTKSQEAPKEVKKVLTQVTSMTQAKLKSDGNVKYGPSICEPRELWRKSKVQCEEALKDLFVEMAFFARLGIVQPPSCLHCVYQESIEKTSPDLRCERFVPWRKDANIPIHPHQLDDNIMLVQCHAARSLVQGEGVEAYRWDKMKRQLVKNH